MIAMTPGSSDVKATTTDEQRAAAPERRLKAIRIVGTALFEYQVQKTPDTRIRLEAFTAMAHQLGDLTANDAAMVAQLLAKPMSSSARVGKVTNG
jgi:hypothetical protein